MGHGNKTHCDRPRVIEALRGKDISFIACGGAHSAAITATGEISKITYVIKINVQYFEFLELHNFGFI